MFVYEAAAADGTDRNEKLTIVLQHIGARRAAAAKGDMLGTALAATLVPVGHVIGGATAKHPNFSEATRSTSGRHGPAVLFPPHGLAAMVYETGNIEAHLTVALARRWLHRR